MLKQLIKPPPGSHQIERISQTKNRTGLLVWATHQQRYTDKKKPGQKPTGQKPPGQKPPPDIIPPGQKPPPDENHPVIIFHVILDDLHGIQYVVYISNKYSIYNIYQ